MLDGFSFTWKHFFHVAIPSALLVLVCAFIFRSNTLAVGYTWDGGGTDGTCGGVAGDGNKWSCAANWSTNVVPTSADTITFDATSVKNATIDAGFAGTVGGITITATYSGTITQARSLTVSGTYSQAAGTFTGSTDSLTVGGTSTFSGGTFNGGTGAHTYTGATTISGATYTKASGVVTHSGALTVSSGSYTSSATSVTIVGLFTLQTTGTFTASSGTTRFKGSFSHLNAAINFLHNNGLVIFDTFDGNYRNYGTTATLDFYNVEFNNTFGAYNDFYIDAGDNLSVTHNLTLTNGSLAGTGTITVGTNTGLSRTVTQAATFDGGLGVVVISGTDVIAVTFTADADAATGMSGFTLNDANATITNSGATGNMEFEAAVTVTAGTFECPTAGPGCQFESTLTVNGGTFNANSAALTVASTGTFSSGTFNGGTGTHTYSYASTYSGATFSKTSGAVNYNSTFTLSGSAFTASSGTTTFKGDFSHTSGTFAHNNGLVVFGSFDGNYRNYGTTATLDFYDVEFNNTFDADNDFYIAMGDNLSVTHNLTLTNGSLAGTGTITVGTNTGLSRTVTQAATFDGGLGVVVISGTDVIAVTFTADADAATGMSGFTLNNANATITNSGATGNMEFEGAVTVTAGTFECPTAGPGCQFETTLTLNGGTFNANNAALTITGTSTYSSGTFNGGTGTNTYNAAVTYSGATFSKTSGAVNYNKDFALSAGTYTATPDTTTKANAGNSADFVHSGTAIFNHNNGSWVFAGTLALRGTYTSASTLTFYDLTINPTNNYGWILSGKTITVIHNLTLTNGDLWQGTINLGTNTGVVGRTLAQAAGFDGSDGSGVVSVTGTDAIAITLAADADATTGMPGFTLNNANATITNSGSTGNMEFEGAVTVTAGTFECPTAGPGCQFERTLTVNGGTFNANSAALTVTGISTFSSGTFNGGTGTNTYGAAFALSGGTHTLSSGTTDFGANVTVTNSPTFSHGNGTVRFTAAETVDVNSTLTLNAVTFPNVVTVTLGTSDTLIASSALALTLGTVNIGTLRALGDVTVGASFGGGTTALSFNGAGNAQTFTLGAVGAFNGLVTVNKSSGAVNLASALTMDAASQTLTVTSGTLDIAGFDLIVNGTLSTVTVAAAGTFQLQGGETTTFLAGNPTLNTGSTVIYTGTVGPYTLKPWSYKKLTLNGAATFSAGAATVVAATLAINPSNVLDLAGFNLTGAGTISNTGTLRLQGGETVTMTNDIDSGTMEFNGTGNYTVTPGTLPFNTFFNVSFSGAAGQWKSSTSFDANGSLTISNGTYTPPAAATVAGDITVSGGTLAGSGTALTLDGTDQTVNGTFTVSSLAKDVIVARTLTLGAGKTVTVTGATTLTGTSAGSRLSLRSSTPTTATSLDMQGTKTLQYLDVQDNTAVTAASCFTGCLDSLRNTNWSFTAGFVIVELGGTTDVTEGAATDTFTVALNFAPTADVTVTTSGTSQVAVDSGSSLIFTSANWATPQTVTVSAVDDLIDEVSPSASSVSLLAASTDPIFSGIGGTVVVNVTDNDVAGTTITESGGSTAVVEGGATDTYTVVLTAQPTADVTITPSGGADLSISPASVTFTSVNWATPQTFTVSAVNDALVEGQETPSITHGISTVDANFAAASIANVVVTVGDNDIAGFVLAESGGTTTVTEGGATDSYTLVLTAQPAEDVVVTIMAPADVTVSVPTLTFTSGNWDTPQTVTVMAVNDLLDEPSPESVSITHASVSADPTFNDLAVGGVTVAVTDNDNPPTLVISDVSYEEIAGTVDMTVTMTGQSQSMVSVAYTTSNGTATAGEDYETASGTVSWTSGQTGAKTFSVLLDEDALDEDDETVLLTLSDAVNGDIADADGVLTITDNDAMPTVEWTLDSQNVDEAAGTVAVTARLSAASGRTVTIPFAFSGTASFPDDYTFDPATALTIAPGVLTAVLQVAIVDDTKKEQAETISIAIGTPTNATVGTNAFQLITVADNEHSGGGSPPPLPPLATAITLLTPNGGEIYRPGDPVTIEWTVPSSHVDFLNYAWSLDDGAHWIDLGSHVSSALVFQWVIPDVYTLHGRFRIEATDLSTVYAFDVSDTPFSILSATSAPVPAEIVPQVAVPQMPVVGELVKNLPQTAMSPTTGLPEAVTPLIWGTFVRSISLSTAYYLDPVSQSRRAVFNALVLHTYDVKLSDIRFVSDATLQFIPLGTGLLPKPGTVLVKNTTDPSVFYFPDLVNNIPLLRWIPSEYIAGVFFGAGWSHYVIDLPFSLLRLFPIGNPLGNGDSVNLDLMKTREELSAPE